ncbi:DUF1343 domain-containing protein [bacterium]|nr:DUF1343 domain-containing protein [bacterium]
MKSFSRLLTAGIIVCTFSAAAKPADFKLGVDVFIESAHSRFTGKKIGLITNATGVTSDLVSTIDALYDLGDPELIKLFGPEHGLRGDVSGGEHVAESTDARTGLPVHSLYGPNRKPTKEMLEDVDVLIYDIQDIGNRTYTYIYTMAYAMQAAAEYGIDFVVFDRPIAMYGRLVDGNVLDPEFSSFIGLYPIPYVYGMTSGELAGYFNKEFRINARLEVIRMEGYCHDMEFADTGLHWVPTSPHIPHAETAYYCAATGCMGELHTVCVGIGYTLPFELVGAEWIDGNQLAGELNSRELPGVYFLPTAFRPYYSVFRGQRCSGVQILIRDHKKFLPFTTQVHILEALQKLYPERHFLDDPEHEGRIASFNKAAGTDALGKAVREGRSADEIIGDFRSALDCFIEKRKEYLLYD